MTFSENRVEIEYKTKFTVGQYCQDLGDSSRISPWYTLIF